MKIKQYNAIHFNGDKFAPVNDTLAVEVALSIAINSEPFTVTMQTPGDEQELVSGLLCTENIIDSGYNNYKIDVLERDANGYITAVNVVIAPERILKDFAGTRNVISASSCGICGKTALDAVDHKKILNTELLDSSLIPDMFEQVAKNQKTFQQSGGTHAAGVFNIKGELLAIKEDIGRHNAVDKAIGTAIQNSFLEQIKCLTVSGRISYEIVNKAKIAEIPFLLSVSAPSSLAVDYAEESGITLLAFCREKKYTVYSNPQQLSTNHYSLTDSK